MPPGRMHADEIPTDGETVRRLLASQFPQWAELYIRLVVSGGTSNAIYRLGDDMAVRLPLRPSYADQAALEFRWLPKLAPHLPVPIAVPLALGAPDEHFPLPWSVCTWLDGNVADPGRIADPVAFAADLSAFVRALRVIDPAGGPAPRSANSGRGAPLAVRDGAVRAALARLEDTIDVAAAAAIWEDSLRAPSWSGPPTWIHGDLNAGNLIMRDGRLVGVIDFGSLAVGDPACDLLAAWYALPAVARPIFRAALEADDASWSRGRGWALSMALIALPYYRDSNPAMVTNALRVIADVLAER